MFARRRRLQFPSVVTIAAVVAETMCIYSRFPIRIARRHPRCDFGGDSTVVGDEAEIETLRSDLRFPDTAPDSASYDEGRWKPMDNKAISLLGGHWE